MDPAQRERVHDDLKGIVKGELLFDDAVAHPLQHRRLAVRDRAARRRRAARRGGRAGPRPLRRREPGHPDGPRRRRRPGRRVARRRRRRRFQPSFPLHSERNRRRGSRAAGRRPPRPGAAAGRVRPSLRPRAGPRRMHPRRHDGRRRLRPPRLPPRLHARPRPGLRVVLDDGSAATVGRVLALAAGRGRARPAAGRGLVGGHAAGAERRGDPRLPAAHAASTAAATCCTTCSTPNSSTWPGCWSAPRARSACSPKSTLRTLPLPAGRSAVLLGLRQPRRRAAGRAGRAAHRPGGVRADRPPPAASGARRRRRGGAGPGRGRGRAASRVRGGRPRRGAPTAPSTWLDRLQPGRAAAAGADGACKPEEIDRFWQVREAALSSLAALRGTEQPVAVVEDAAVPTEAAAGVPAPRAGGLAAPRERRRRT